MMVNSLIDLTIREIARHYQSGALPWMKPNRPDEWGKVLTLERAINNKATGGDIEGLEEALSAYQGANPCHGKAVQGFKKRKEQGAFNFVGRPKSPRTG